jgi:predicted molibdopterin-dependent oxidoreductase YjgC
MMKTEHNLVIDDKTCTFQPGETVLEVARNNDVYIPTLCHLKRTTPSGACRICMVEVDGARNLLAACATPAGIGMVIQSESDKVMRTRKEIIKLMLSNGDHNCLLCASSGDCTLQDLAYQYQIPVDSYPVTPTKHKTEKNNPFIIRDFSRCILCGRCVQVCKDVQVNNAIDYGFRGAELKIITAGNKTLKNSDCVYCGDCIQVCPTGALVEKNVQFKVRSWETEKTRTTCGYCGVGCQVELHTKHNKVVKATGVEDTAPNYGSLCVKGRFAFDFIDSPERLKTPLVKVNGEFREASWDEALGLVAKNLGRIKDEYGADSIGVLTSARITNEDNYIVQKFTRAVLKTNNIDHCARL